jgi:hypothetical protein
VSRVLLALALLAAATAGADAQTLDATLKSSHWPELSLRYPSALLEQVPPTPTSAMDKNAALTPALARRDKLRSKDGKLEVALGGDYNTTLVSGAGEFAEDWVKALGDRDRAVVTFSAHEGNWAVAAGVFGGRAFYLRVVARCTFGARLCSQPNTFASAAFTYPLAEHQRFDALVKAMGETLTAALPAD